MQGFGVAVVVRACVWLLLLVAIVAAVFPAWRAARVDPMTVLPSE